MATARHRRRLRAGQLAATVAAIMALLVACADGGGDVDGALPTFAEGEGPSEAVGSPVLSVRRVRLGPEPSPPFGVDLDDFPRWFVTADGWLLAPARGDVALPTIEATPLGVDGLALLRRLVKDAGLHEPGGPPRVDADGDGWEFAYTDESDGLAVTRVAHDDERVQRLLDALADPAGSFGASVRSAGRYTPRAYRVVAAPLDEEVAHLPSWPVPDLPLAALQDCAVLHDADAAALAEELLADGEGAQLSSSSYGIASGLWRNEGWDYRVTVRPLLPGEMGCAPPAP